MESTDLGVPNCQARRGLMGNLVETSGMVFSSCGVLQARIRTSVGF